MSNHKERKASIYLLFLCLKWSKYGFNYLLSYYVFHSVFYDNRKIKFNNHKSTVYFLDYENTNQPRYRIKEQNAAERAISAH